MSSEGGNGNSEGRTPRVATINKPAENNQAKYGKDLPLPQTYVRCGSCQSLFAITPDDIGGRGGCKLECGLCGHSWYQSRDKLFDVKDGFEFMELPETDLARVKSNIEAGRRPNFMGNSKLYVGNLDFKCTEEDLLALFSEKAGEVGEINIVRDNTGRSRGFAFITMMTEEGGKKGLEMNGDELLGRNLQVREPNN